MNRYTSHVTSSGALCHDRTTSCPEQLRHLYQNERGDHLCLFGAYDNYRTDYVRAKNISESKEAARFAAGK